MRSAIRGDFERLAERRGEQELMRLEPSVDQAPAAEHRDEEKQPRSWLARLISP